MTFPGRTPTWDEIEEFCRIDGWEHIRSTDHEFWQKALPSGEVLETHTSFAGNKSMSPGRFGAILRRQLKVSRSEFWRVLHTGEPADRPSEDDEPSLTHEGWVVEGLKRLGITEDEIRELRPDDARSLLYTKWSEQQ